jgi:hypothetical protein
MTCAAIVSCRRYLEVSYLLRERPPFGVAFMANSLQKDGSMRGRPNDLLFVKVGDRASKYTAVEER